AALGPPGAPRTLGLLVGVAPGVVDRAPQRTARRFAAEDQLPRVGDLVEQRLQLLEAHLCTYSHQTPQRLAYSFGSLLSSRRSRTLPTRITPTRKSSGAM